MFLPSNITLQFGDSGDFVSELQRRLAMVKCFSDDMVNGFYDGNTVNGVTRFQAMVGLHADGAAGPETLRRLNGVISGGGTADSSKKDEEKTPEAAQNPFSMLYAMPPSKEDPLALGIQQPPQQQQVVTQQTELPPMQPLNEQHQLQEQARQQEQAQQRQQQGDASLAAMLLTQSPQRNEHQPTEQKNERQHHGAQQLVAAEHERKAAAEPEAAREPKGIIGRVMQFANATLQRLSDYFEAKLPPSVMNEVREIGQVMAQHGMKEAPIPTGPEMIRTPQTPARQEQISRA